MKIEQISIYDMAEVYELGKASFVEEKGGESFVYNYWSLQQLAQMIEEYPEYSLIARDRDTGELVGFVLGHPSYEEIVEIGYLEWIAVDPQFRGQGIATKLVEALLEIYREKGETRIVTDVKGINRESFHLFTNKFGFKEKEVVSFLVKELE